jgi:hypothetical protein
MRRGQQGKGERPSWSGPVVVRITPSESPLKTRDPWFRTKQFAWASLALDPEKIFTEPHELERWHRTPPED